jgi:CheY-like chemotaxis protein
LPARGTTIRQLTNGLFAPAAPSSKPGSFSDDSSDRHEAFSCSVLLVEDNPINQKVACLMLERIGHRVVVAANGKEAMAALQGNRFDVVLMDCQMPEMDGFEATRRIRAEEQAGRHLPIIAMTANAMLSDREQCLSAGMDDYLSKPVRLSDLASMLERWLPPG